MITLVRTLAPPVYHGLRKQHGVHSNTSELPSDTLAWFHFWYHLEVFQFVCACCRAHDEPRRRKNFPGIPGPALERGGETESCRLQVSISTRQCVNGIKDSQYLPALPPAVGHTHYCIEQRDNCKKFC